MTEIEKLTAGHPDTQSADIVAGNIEALRALFPEAFSEGKIDFEVLKQCLGGVVDDREEKYGLNWHGKRRARQIALTPSTGTLLPCLEDSVDWDTTQNLMIEGDNLEVLKLLQKSYAGKVKMIYIDPPYNTGKDFVYRDDFRDSIANYLALTGQIDSAGKKSTSNTESSGRFHTDWLNMMYPRLKLAREMLRADGTIFISIDDVEVKSVRTLCDEIFGEENFICTIVWQKVYSPANDKKGVDAMHDYVIAYQKSASFNVNLLPRTSKQDDAYSNQDNDPRGPWKAVDTTRAEHRDYAYYPITTPSGREVYPAQGRSWVFTKEELPGLIADNRLWFGKDGNSKPSKKLFLTEVKQGIVPTTWWSHEDGGHNDGAKKELKALMPEGLPFQTPKPTKLIQRIAQIATSPHGEDIILDFFAGSGTTADAILRLNTEDDGNRRVVLVQIPEATGQADYPTIADICKERFSRVGRKVRTEKPAFSGDLGFRAYKLAASNIRAWEPNVSDLEATLFNNTEHLVPGRTEADILTELLLKLGLDLCVPIETKDIAGKSVHSVGAGALIVCLSDGITRETVEGLAQGIIAWWQALAPAGDTRIVFKDSAFADDVAKTNMAAILNQAGIKDMRSL